MCKYCQDVAVVVESRHAECQGLEEDGLTQSWPIQSNYYSQVSGSNVFKHTQVPVMEEREKTVQVEFNTGAIHLHMSRTWACHPSAPSYPKTMHPPPFRSSYLQPELPCKALIQPLHRMNLERVLNSPLSSSLSIFFFGQD